MHHLCYEVDDIHRRARPAQGCRRACSGRRRSLKIGAHGKPVLFLHPKDFVGTLVEIEQV